MTNVRALTNETIAKMEPGKLYHPVLIDGTIDDSLCIIRVTHEDEDKVVYIATKDLVNKATEEIDKVNSKCSVDFKDLFPGVMANCVTPKQKINAYVISLSIADKIVVVRLQKAALDKYNHRYSEEVEIRCHKNGLQILNAELVSGESEPLTTARFELNNHVVIGGLISTPEIDYTPIIGI